MMIIMSQEALKKTEECEQEIEKRKQFLKNHLVEISHENQPLAQKTSYPEVGFLVFSLMSVTCPKATCDNR